MGKYRLTIIGFGGMAGWHLRTLREKVPSINPTGVFDIREEALEKAREAGLHAYGSLQQLLDDQSIDLVLIATPNDVHKSLAIACLQAGKNVVCEKPVTLNAGELEEIITVARQTGKLFSIHQNRRWDRDYVIARKVLNDGLIGRPYFVESRVLGSRGSMFGWRGYKQNGGGMLLDWGVHLIDQALQLFPEPVTSINAHLVHAFGQEVDDQVKVLLRFKSGVSYLIEMSTNCFVLQPRWHISGTEGTLVIEDWDCRGKVVSLKPDSEMEWADDIVYTSAGPTRTMAPRPKQTTLETELPDLQSDAADYYHNIADVLDNKAELIVKPEQALRVMRVIDAAFESQRLGHGVPCNI